MQSEKKEIVLKVVETLKSMNVSNKDFIAGYMIGVQQERERNKKLENEVIKVS